MVMDMQGAVSSTESHSESSLEDLGILRWMRSLSYRVPGASAILVGSHCDCVGNSPDQTALERLYAAASDVESQSQKWVHKWTTQRQHSQFPIINLEEGVSLVDCRSTRGEIKESWPCDVNSPSLLHRITHTDDGCTPRGVDMLLPLSWKHALDLLDKIAQETR